MTVGMIAMPAKCSAVVPAKAGTHNHRRSSFGEMDRDRANDHFLWLWVPGRASLARDDVMS